MYVTDIFTLELRTTASNNDWIQLFTSEVQNTIWTRHKTAKIFQYR